MFDRGFPLVLKQIQLAAWKLHSPIRTEHLTEARGVPMQE